MILELFFGKDENLKNKKEKGFRVFWLFYSITFLSNRKWTDDGFAIVIEGK